jgi:hypothetical protein
VGGWLDLIRGKPVPALVYRAGKHIINVFVLPARPGDFSETLEPAGCWSAPGGPLEPFASVTCYLTCTQ